MITQQKTKGIMLWEKGQTIPVFITLEVLDWLGRNALLKHETREVDEGDDATNTIHVKKGCRICDLYKSIQ